MEPSGFGAAHATGSVQRLWHVQWLRGYAMLLGVPFDAGLIYSVGVPWFVTSPDRSEVVTVITGWITSFRMPLFFYVAGLLSAVSLSRREPRAWLMRRVERLGVPLVTSTLVLSPVVIVSMAYSSARNLGQRQFQNALHQLLARPGAHWVGHLWFLQVLLIFSLVAVAALPVFDRLKPSLFDGDGRGGFDLPLPWVFGAAAAVTVYVLGEKAVLAVAHARLGFEDPLWGMLKTQEALDFLPFFLIGLFIYNVRLPAIHRSALAWTIIGISLLLFARHWNEPAVSDKLVRYTCNVMIAVLGGCMILDLSSRLVTGPGRLTEFLAANAFTVYLVHYPIVVWLGTMFVAVHWNPVVEYLLIVSVTLGLAFLVHAVVRRSRLLTYLVNGERGRAPRRISPHADAPQMPLGPPGIEP